MILPTPADPLFAATYYTDTILGGLFTISLQNSFKIGSFHSHQNSYCACSGLICLPKGDDKLFSWERAYTCSRVTVTVSVACKLVDYREPLGELQSTVCTAGNTQSLLSYDMIFFDFAKKNNILCSSLLSSSSSSSSLPPGKPKSSIKKTTRDVPAFFWLFDQPHSTGETLHSKKIKNVCALTNTTNNCSTISNKYITRISFRYIRSAPDFLSFHSWIHLYYVHILLSATRSTC